MIGNIMVFRFVLFGFDNGLNLFSVLYVWLIVFVIFKFYKLCFI